MKKAFSTRVFSKSCVTRFPGTFSFGPTFSLVFLLLCMYLQRPFFLSLTSLPRFNSGQVLSFLTPSLHAQSVSVCIPGYLYLLLPSRYFLLCSSLFRSFLAIFLSSCSLECAALKYMTLIINQLSWIPLSTRVLSHGILPSRSLRTQSPGLRSCFLLCCLLSGCLTPPSHSH